MKIFEITTSNNLNSNFRKWFSGSKLIDTQGNPLVFYHGTSANISTFDSNKIGSRDFGFLGKGFYFSNYTDRASAYADSADGDHSPNVVPVYLSIKNPFYSNLGEKVPPTEQLKKLGYDGIIANLGPDSFWKIEKRTQPPDELEVVAFYPYQIKSIFNNGSWGLSGDLVN